MGTGPVPAGRQAVRPSGAQAHEASANGARCDDT